MPLTSESLHSAQASEFAKYGSRRSVVHSTKGIVSCTQPLAAKCGIQVLQAGGNAADAAVAVAAGLNMTEPCSTGIGGDMFILFYDATTGNVSAMNGSGRSAKNATLDTIRRDLGVADGARGKIPMKSVHAVTVPGAAAGWVDTVERFGSGNVSLEQVLAPAIELGEKGFPVSELTSHYWNTAEPQIREASPNFAEMLKKDPNAPDGVRAPNPGEIMKNPTLAQTFRALAKDGKKGFYTGRVAEELVRVVKSLGGHLELDDLAHHLEQGSEPVDPISLKFKPAVKSTTNGHAKGHTNGHSNGHSNDGAVEVWEHPPNGQGIVALMALGIIQELQASGVVPAWSAEDHNTAPYLHVIIEALRLAFTDASWYVTDPNVVPVPSAGLISPEYSAARARLFKPDSAIRGDELRVGSPPGKQQKQYASPALQSSDTVYFTVSDEHGNAASFINSNYGGFGTCIIPRGCGFTLQNRGANFSLDADHPNRLAPRKRPYHTIIPAMVTNQADGSLHSSFGVMGGFMQPQGHVQVLLGQLVAGLSPQQTLDAPRVCIVAGLPDRDDDFDWTVSVEEGMPEETVEGLRELGHKVEVVRGTERGLFGRGQIIRYTVDPVEGTGVWSAGSDPRGDGAAYPAL
ncbi:gamma-glutamyltranspeptidase [Colletotrichum higginsianum]|uniref:Putative gamma-glutamyltransferase YwrD n=1 Tax=Colletotrichum higginsianum TaxID=80884 RepID=A0A4T0VL46_9PEZI|nr:putative gamma-glutamyltransferase YwrD [Colletotrichum higginsianum]GJC98532.1 gamma-glutamyltranspeptidase [Colletotrichum higginsianum]